MKKKNLLIQTAVLLLLLLAAGTVLAQGSAMNKDSQKVTMKGKIGYMEQSRVYLVICENPPDEVFIVNPNKKVLDKLKKSGKTVTIEGHYTIGADHLMIDKIDGKKY
jgi:hypothetical protein